MHHFIKKAIQQSLKIALALTILGGMPVTGAFAAPDSAESTKTAQTKKSSSKQTKPVKSQKTFEAAVQRIIETY